MYKNYLTEFQKYFLYEIHRVKASVGYIIFLALTGDDLMHFLQNYTRFYDKQYFFKYVIVIFFPFVLNIKDLTY